MVLPLDTEVADPGRVELRAMTESEFDDYIDGSTTTYAAELAAAGMSQRSARAQAAEQLATLLPAGLESPGQSFFTAWVGEAMMNAGAHWSASGATRRSGSTSSPTTPGARALYDKLGYRVTADFRSLELGAVG
jgi:hypothetical protein